MADWRTKRSGPVQSRSGADSLPVPVALCGRWALSIATRLWTASMSRGGEGEKKKKALLNEPLTRPTVPFGLAVGWKQTFSLWKKALV